MLNRMRRAEQRIRNQIIQEAAYQGRGSFQPPKSVGTPVTGITSFNDGETTPGPDGQTQWPFTAYIDGAYDENALVPKGFPITNYEN